MQKNNRCPVEEQNHRGRVQNEGTEEPDDNSSIGEIGAADLERTSLEKEQQDPLVLDFLEKLDEELD